MSLWQEYVTDGPVPWATKNNVSFICEQVSHHPPSKWTSERLDTIWYDLICRCNFYIKINGNVQIYKNTKIIKYQVEVQNLIYYELYSFLINP